MNKTTRIACLCSFTLLLSMAGCGNSGSPVKAELNESASLPDNLPFHPLQWRVISTAINKPESSMYTLYGNDLAIEYARSNPKNDYPAGAVLALVGWVQRDDEHWFGGKIPDRVRSVEFVEVKPGADHRPSYVYQDYEGRPLKKTGAYEGLVPNERVAYLLSQRAAVMP